MTKQFWIFLGVGLAVVGALISGVFVGTKGSHLELNGSILKVRILSLNPEASIVAVDFRVTNPSDIPFVVGDASIKLEASDGTLTDGRRLSKPDVDNVFQYAKLIGPKYNDVLSIRDTVGPHETVDRMVAARFELSESQIDARKAIRLLLEEIDGAPAELTEDRSQ